MTFIKKLLAPPVFEDEEKTHQAYLLHTILLALIIIPIPYVIYVLIQVPEESNRALALVMALEIINIIPFIMLRHGYVHPASAIQIIIIWFFFAIISVTSAGVYGVAYLLGNGLVIIISGILLGGHGALAMTLLTVIEGGIMVYAELHGWSPPDILDDALPTWIVSIVLFCMGAILQQLASRTLRMALTRARASEEKYRLISQVSSDYTFATEVHKDGSASLSWVAGAFEKMTGYTYEEYVASGSWLAHVHPDDLEKDAQDMAKLHKNQDIKSEIRTFTKNGGIRWEQIFAHPVWDEKENQLIGIFGAVRDITEQKQIEAALAHERDLLQIFLDNIPDTVYFKDAESRFVRINKAQTRFLGIDNPQDAIGKTDLDFQNSELAREFMAEEKQIIETNQSVLNRIEFNPTDDGKPRWLSATKVPVKDRFGRTVGIIGISRDITEQKKAEEFEQRRHIMLEKVINLGKQVTESDNLPSTIKKIWHGVRDDLGFDRLGIYLYNSERRSMDGTFGTNNQGEMVDEWHTSFSIGFTFADLLQNPNGMYFTKNYDVENNIPAGHEMYGIKDYVAVAAWAGDKPVAVICADHGITHRPISVEQLEALRLFGGYAGLAIENARLNEAIQKELFQRKAFIEELEAKNAELERFTYTVSHDLKSPLVTIRGFLGYLEQDAQSGNYEKFQQDVHRIETAVEKMQNLLKDLLELSRVGRLMNTPVEIPFNEIVKDVLELMDGQIKEKNVLIEYQNNNVIINCDRARMLEVLQNLIDNAIKFMGDQPSPHIEIGTSINDRSETIFYIKDNGIGIAPEFQERIFGLFNKLTSDSEGTGIGLALVKRIIEVHGGRVWVESQVGKGTTFYFTLP